MSKTRKDEYNVHGEGKEGGASGPPAASDAASWPKPAKQED